jgi:hypothetical protein
MPVVLVEYVMKEINPVSAQLFIVITNNFYNTFCVL